MMRALVLLFCGLLAAGSVHAQQPAFRPKEAGPSDQAAAAAQGALNSVVYAANYMKCNLATDDSPGLQRAINFAAARGARKLVLPAGVCRLDSTVTLTKPMIVEGAGMGGGSGSIDNQHGTVLMANFANGDVIQATSLYGFTFRDFQINTNVGPRASGAGLNIRKLSSPSNSTSKVERVSTNGQYIGIKCTSCHFFEMSGTYHQAWVRSAYLADGDASDEAGGGYIHHNWFSGSQANGTSQVAVIESHVGYIRVESNIIIGAQIGVYLHYDRRAAGSSVISDNSIENQTVHSVFMDNASGIVANNVQISRNEFMVTSADTGAYINNFIRIFANTGGTGSWISNIQINENTFVGQFGNSGVFPAYLNLGTGDNVAVYDNTIQHYGGDVAFKFIIGAEVGNAILRDNTHMGTSSAVKYFLSNSTTKIIDRQGLPFASLPSGAANGSCIYVPDGTTGSTFNATLTGGGTGAFAGRLNGAWVNHC